MADRLIQLAKPATPALLQALRDPERGVAAHLILCAIWNGRIESSEERIYQGSEISGFRYSAFGLAWKVNFTYPPDAPPPIPENAPFDLAKLTERAKYAKVENSVEAEDLERNFGQWCKRLPRKYRGPCP